MNCVKRLYILIIMLSHPMWAHCEEPKKTKISVLEYNEHTFLWFNEHQIIHDPDCRCALKWEGFIRNKNSAMPKIELYRSRISDHD